MSDLTLFSYLRRKIAPIAVPPREGSFIFSCIPMPFGQECGEIHFALGVKRMPKAYFEPATIAALGEVLKQAKAILERRGEDTPANLDWVAQRILHLASEGLAPSLILAEVVRPMSPSEAGLNKVQIRLSPEDPMSGAQ